MSSEIMHVGIENPSDKRRKLLNIAVDNIQALKAFEAHKELLKEKDAYRQSFIKIIQELSKSIKEFKETMPAVHVPEMMREERKEIRIEPIEIKKPVSRKKTRLEELEDDINRLKNKISTL